MTIYSQIVHQLPGIRRFSFGPRGAGIRRLTGRQKIKGNQYQKERLIRHTSQSGHGSGDSGPKWLAHPRSENHAEEKSSHPQRRGPRFFVDPQTEKKKKKKKIAGTSKRQLSKLIAMTRTHMNPKNHGERTTHSAVTPILGLLSLVSCSRQGLAGLYISLAPAWTLRRSGAGAWHKKL